MCTRAYLNMGMVQGKELIFLVVMMQGYVRLMVQILQLLLGTPAKLSMLFQVLHEVEVTLGLVLTGD